MLVNLKIFHITANAGDPRNYYHRYQVVETAKQLDYFADLRSYHSWIQLVINSGNSTIILISFHGLGREYRGLLACSACSYHRDNSEENEQNISEIEALSSTPFQFSYADDENALTDRFRKWLDDVIVAANGSAE